METKRFEAMKAVAEGAREIDMVMNISAVKSGDWQYVQDDMSSLAQVCHQQGAIFKVILETCLLTEEEKKRACEIAVRANVDFVKTSTGFAKGGATANDVAFMRHTVGKALGVKASGGVKGIEDARVMFEAGATRIGASVGVKIAQEAGGVKSTIVAGNY